MNLNLIKIKFIRYITTSDLLIPEEGRGVTNALKSSAGEQTWKRDNIGVAGVLKELPSPWTMVLKLIMVSVL